MKISLMAFASLGFTGTALVGSALGQTAPCVIRTIAGPPSFFTGDSGPAAEAFLNQPQGFRFDANGNAFIADTRNNRIREVTPDGLIHTIAGTGVPGFSGDGGLAVNAQINNPVQVGPDGQGNLYIADGGNRIRKIDANGIMSTFAGNGTPNFAGDGGLAVQAELQTPQDVLAGKDGEVFIADTGNFRVRKVDAQGFISTVAGSGMVEPSYGYLVTTPPRQLNGPATAYSFSQPSSIALDASGQLYIGDTGLVLVYRVDANGAITIFAGTGSLEAPVAGQSATSTPFNPQSMAFDSAGNLVIASPFSPGGGIFAVSPAGAVSQLTSDESLSIAINGGTTYFQFLNSIYELGSYALLAGLPHTGTTGDGGLALDALLSDPGPLAVDAQTNVYFADAENLIRKVASNGDITLFAGNGTPMETGDGGPATQAGIGDAFGIGVDPSGNVYVADAMSIREVNALGVIASVLPEYAGLQPVNVAVAPSGVFYFQQLASGLYSAVRGQTRGNARQILPAYGSGFAWALDPSGNLYWTTGEGDLSTLHVDSTVTEVPLAVQGGTAVQLAVDGFGNVYVAVPNGSLFEVLPSGAVFTLARHDTTLPFGDGPAHSVDLGQIAALTSDAVGNLYFSDQTNSLVRELTAGCPVVAQPLISPNGVVNAASYDGSSLAAGEIASIFGTGIGPSTGSGVPVANGAFPSSYADVAVTVNDYPAPLLYASANQVNIVVPFEVEGQRTLSFQLTYAGVASDPYSARSGEANPSVFAISNADYTINSATNPASAGSYVVVYGTGQGLSSTPQADGAIATDLLSPVLPVTAILDGNAVPVLYAGSAPGLVAGVLQVNVPIPTQFAPGLHEISIAAGEWGGVQEYSFYTK